MNIRLMTHFIFLMFVFVSGNSYSKDDEPVLVIESKYHHYFFSRTKLVSMKSLAHISINNNRAYPNMEMTYSAIKLCDLLKPFSIKLGDTLEFIAADRFSVLIPAKYIMSCNKNSAIGYLAIEPVKKWPLLRYKTGTTAGPFDVIWVYPEKSYISDEYWAWSVVRIIVHEKLDSNLIPDVPNIQDRQIRDRIKNGYNKYISHCAACHAINHIGKGVIGPDLNIPKNPVEYYPDDNLLKKFIRDPQSVWVIKHDRMSGSSKQFLSDADLDDLLLYFHYMAKHKLTSIQPLKK